MTTRSTNQSKPQTIELDFQDAITVYAALRVTSNTYKDNTNKSSHYQALADTIAKRLSLS